MTYTDRDVIELACRAPAVPDWFEPDMSGQEIPKRIFTPITYGRCKNRHGVTLEEYFILDEVEKRAILQWPKAYARMVLEARHPKAPPKNAGGVRCGHKLRHNSKRRRHVSFAPT